MTRTLAASENSTSHIIIINLTPFELKAMRPTSHKELMQIFVARVLIRCINQEEST